MQPSTPALSNLLREHAQALDRAGAAMNALFATQKRIRDAGLTPAMLTTTERDATRQRYLQLAATYAALASKLE